MVVPSFAFEDSFRDYDSVDDWDGKFGNVSASITAEVINMINFRYGFDSTVTGKTLLWSLFNTAVSKTGEVSLVELSAICQQYNDYFNKPVESSLFAFKDYASNLKHQVFATCLGLKGINFEVQKHPASGLMRIRELTTGYWVVNSNGAYPYCEGGSSAATSGGDTWLGEMSASTAATSGKVVPVTLDRLNMVCLQLKSAGLNVQIKPLGGKYMGLWYNRQYLANSQAMPYV